MSPATTLALAKLLGKLEAQARTEVSPGTHKVDDTVTLRVQGTLTVGADSEYRPTTSIPWKAALALFVRYSGITREAALAALVRAMREALATEAEAEELLLGLADLEAAEAEVQASLEQLPDKTRLGAVRTKQVVLKEVA